MRRDSAIAAVGAIPILVALGKLVADSLRHPNSGKEIVFTDHAVKVLEAKPRQPVGR